MGKYFGTDGFRGEANCDDRRPRLREIKQRRIRSDSPLRRSARFASAQNLIHEFVDRLVERLKVGLVAAADTVLKMIL